MTTEFEDELGDDVGIFVGIFVGALLGACVGDDVGCVVVGAGVDMDAGLDRRHISLSSHGANSHCYIERNIWQVRLEHER